jgi:hypothetical protein
MANMFCALCGKSLSTRELKYIVRINIISDFDNAMPNLEDETSDEFYGFFDEDEGVENHLMDDLASQELSLYLCVHCKKKFARDWIDSEEEGSFTQKKDLDIVYH